MRSELWVLTLAALAPFACGDEGPGVRRCELSADCAGEEVCTEAGECRGGLACGTDRDCDPRRRCEAGACPLRPRFGDECDPDRPCALGEFCSALLGRCLEASAARDCTARSQCPGGQLCDRSASKCVAVDGCYGDAFCDEGEACNLVTRSCGSRGALCAPCSASGACETGACRSEAKECLTMGADPVCGSGEFCDPSGRCVDCTRNSECGPGLFCNLSLGRCESALRCTSDAINCPDAPEVECIVCAAPQVCDPRTLRCQAPDARCDDDLDCSGEQLCDESRSPPICVPRLPDCLADLSEPNNRPETASMLPSGADSTIAELTLCPGDVDWYRIDVAAGTFLTIDARFEHEAGDIDLELFLADGTTSIKTARSLTDNERIELEVGTALSLLLRVDLARPAVRRSDYSLILRRDPAASCPDDAAEEDDSRATARTIESDLLYDGTLCAADPDWFRLEGVPAGTRIDVELSFPSGLGNLDLELYRGGSETPRASARSSGSGESLSYETAFAGDFALRVLGAGADQNVYQLRASLRPATGAVCADDRFEPSDEPALASVVAAEAPLAGLTICDGDEDWYVLPLNGGEALTAEVAVTNRADLDLMLYAPGADPGQVSPIRAAFGQGRSDFLAYRAPSDGDYLLRVLAAAPGTRAEYDLRLAQLPPSCAPDEFDARSAGDSRDDPVPFPLESGRLESLSLCANDIDFFSLELLPGTITLIHLFFLSEDAPLELTLLDATGAELISTFGEGDQRTLRWPLEALATETDFLLEVKTSGFTGSPYALRVEQLPAPACPVDPNEPNERLELATAITATTSLGATFLCTSEVEFAFADEDWYAIEVPAGASLVAELNHSASDLFLELLGPSGGRPCPPGRCYSDGVTGREQVSYTATVTAPHYLRVGSIYGVFGVPLPEVIHTAYQLDVRLETP